MTKNWIAFGILLGVAQISYGTDEKVLLPSQPVLVERIKELMFLDSFLDTSLVEDLGDKTLSPSEILEFVKNAYATVMTQTHPRVHKPLGTMRYGLIWSILADHPEAKDKAIKLFFQNEEIY